MLFGNVPKKFPYFIYFRIISLCQKRFYKYFAGYLVSTAASLKKVTQINKHGWNVCFDILMVVLTLQKCFLSSLKSTFYSRDTQK